MPCYAIGDVQGCYDELCELLETIQFNPNHDRLWLVGDLVNRGPKSLQVLELLYSLRHQTTIVLGNHDFHLLAVYFGVRKTHGMDTLDEVLQSPKVDVLCEWLMQQPLFHYDDQLQCAMVHAGVPWQWTWSDAKSASDEVCAQLKNRDTAIAWMQHLYGNLPLEWSTELQGWDRLRYIVNAFTRMRFVDAGGHLDLASHHLLGMHTPGSMPWFEFPDRRMANIPIVFGHWASLNGKTTVPNVYALDTGCVWGQRLTAIRIEDKKRFSIASHQPPRSEE